MKRLGGVRVRRTMATVVVIVAAWELIARAFFPVYILPPPSTVLAALAKLAVSGELTQHVGISLFRAVAGFVIAALLGTLLGIATGWWRAVDDTVGSVLELLRPVPSLALIPLAIVWLGFGEISKIVVIAYASFFSVYVNTNAGVRNIDPLHVKVMRVYGRGTRDVLTKVVAYSILPYAMTGLRYSAAIALILLVAVELVGGQSGVGYFLVQSQNLLQMPEMFAAIMVFGLMGFTANLLLLALERRLIHWRHEELLQR